MGELVIVDGRINATGNDGAVIGSGASLNGRTSLEELLISGGSIWASSERGAAVGAGWANHSASAVDVIRLEGESLKPPRALRQVSAPVLPVTRGIRPSQLLFFRGRL